MCNADAAQLPRWVVFTCVTVKGSAEKKYTERLGDHILRASGGQFPVAGIVREDMDGRGSAIFAFCDGVTVSIPGIANWTHEQPTAQQTADAMNPKVAPAVVQKYPRIQSAPVSPRVVPASVFIRNHHGVHN